jgi:pimeloyl-ACP methyl ester carboxylesterase
LVFVQLDGRMPEDSPESDTDLMVVRPFSVEVPSQELEDLQRRLALVRWPPWQVVSVLTEGVEIQPGLQPVWLRGLVGYWRDGFDWWLQEATLNEFKQVKVDVSGRRLHAVWVNGTGPAPLPLLLCHGWPSSFVEFTKIIPLLTDPASFGGDELDSFTVVAPSLPGYLFSEPLPAGRSGDTVSLFAGLMRELGYETFGAHGGDIGSYIVHRLALDYPERLVGVHVTYPAEPPSTDVNRLSPEEREFLAERPVTHEQGGGYAHIQRTRPLTLAYGLTDSPVGLAAWILDKWREWTDCAGDLTRRFTHDELLTLVTLYWVTGTIGSSFNFYRDWGLGAPASLIGHLYPLCPSGVEPRPLEGHPIEVPTAIASAYIRYPGKFAARAYRDLRQVTNFAAGGHFLAYEEPELLAEDLRRFFRPLRASKVG